MSSRKRADSTDRRQFWRRTVKAWKSSGLSVRQFCRKEGISAPSFYSWRKKLAQRKPQRAGAKRRRRASTFIEVSVPDSAPAPLELVLPTGAILRIAPGTDSGFVQRVLSVLQEAGLC